MPDDIAGNYSLPAGSTATPLTDILSVTHNTPIADMASALSNRLSVDGRKPMTGLQLLSGDGADPLHAATKRQMEAAVAAEAVLARNASNLASGTVSDAVLPTRLASLGTVIPSGGSLAAYTKFGGYRFNTGVIDSPFSPASDYSNMLSMSTSDTAGQLVIGYASGKLYARGAYGIGGTPTWSAWAEYLSKVEQDARYAQLSGATFTGYVYAPGLITLNESVSSNSANIILSAAGGGGVYIRPAGVSNSTNQLLHTTTALTVGGNAIHHDGNRPRAKSSQLTMAASGQLTFAHGLGAQPERWYAYIVCQTAEYGYAVGDTIMVAGYDAPSTAQTAVWSSTTTVGLTYNNLRLPVKSTGALSSGSITPASWKLILAAEL